jgi:hypothetical protein
MSPQVVFVSSRTTAFTVVCTTCARAMHEPGWSGATFAGRLDLDLDGGMFLCRRGHEVRVEREGAAGSQHATEAA